jgi:hypothetical protein
MKTVSSDGKKRIERQSKSITYYIILDNIMIPNNTLNKNSWVSHQLIDSMLTRLSKDDDLVMRYDFSKNTWSPHCFVYRHSYPIQVRESTCVLSL